MVRLTDWKSPGGKSSLSKDAKLSELERWGLERGRENGKPETKILKVVQLLD